MKRDEERQAAQKRAIEVFNAKPGMAQSTTVGTAQVGEGLTCRFTQGEHSAVMDMAAAVGGDDQGPTPGFFGRAAIAGCVAIGLKMTAIREGLEFHSVEVEIAQDYDDRGVLGFEGVPATALGSRLSIRIDSAEPEQVVHDLVDRTLAADPWFLAYRDAQAVAIEMQLTQTA